jgi:hypothetical protein
MPRRFTLAGLLLCVTFVGLMLAIVVPLWRHTRRVRTYAAEIVVVAASADGSTFGVLVGYARVAWSPDGHAIAAEALRNDETETIERWELASRHVSR